MVKHSKLMIDSDIQIKFFHIKVEVPKHHSSQEIIYNLMDDSYIQIKCSDGFGLQKPGSGRVQVGSGY